jgi:hypothetical protein
MGLNCEVRPQRLSAGNKYSGGKFSFWKDAALGIIFLWEGLDGNQTGLLQEQSPYTRGLIISQERHGNDEGKNSCITHERYAATYKELIEILLAADRWLIDPRCLIEREIL